MANEWKHSHSVHTKNFHNERKSIEWLLLSSDVKLYRFRKNFHWKPHRCVCVRCVCVYENTWLMEWCIAVCCVFFVKSMFGIVRVRTLNISKQTLARLLTHNDTLARRMETSRSETSRQFEVKRNGNT